MDRAKTLGGVLLLLLVLPIALHAVFVAVPSANSYVVGSQSMSPAIPAGSLIYVVDTGEYDVGDVVTFERGGATITHRIVERTDDGYVTKGDANDRRDAPISRSQIVGEVVLALPFYGFFFDVAGSPLGYGLLVVVPALLLLWLELRDRM